MLSKITQASSWLIPSVCRPTKFPLLAKLPRSVRSHYFMIHLRKYLFIRKTNIMNCSRFLRQERPHYKLMIWAGCYSSNAYTLILGISDGLQTIRSSFVVFPSLYKQIMGSVPWNRPRTQARQKLSSSHLIRHWVTATDDKALSNMIHTYSTGARSSVVGGGSILQAGRSRIRIPMRSLVIRKVKLSL
jgi:hypothetical protein